MTFKKNPTPSHQALQKDRGSGSFAGKTKPARSSANPLAKIGEVASSTKEEVDRKELNAMSLANR